MSDDDDFQNPSHTLVPVSKTPGSQGPSRRHGRSSSQSRSALKVHSSQTLLPPSKRFKLPANPGKENEQMQQSPPSSTQQIRDKSVFEESSPPPSLRPVCPEYFDGDRVCSSIAEESDAVMACGSSPAGVAVGKLDKDELCAHFVGNAPFSNFSIESRLLESRLDHPPKSHSGDHCFIDESENYEPGTQLDALLNLCCSGSPQDVSTGTENHCPNEEGNSGIDPVHCPLCRANISDLSDEQRLVHTNDCLDREESLKVVIAPNNSGQAVDGPSVPASGQVVDALPVVEWLRNLGLRKYEGIFIREEIDWDTLNLLTEEDFLRIGVTALGPRKKIMHALDEFKRGNSNIMDTVDTMKTRVDGTDRVAGNKLITEFFAGSVTNRNTSGVASKMIPGKQSQLKSGHKQCGKLTKHKQIRGIPLWCCIPGTPFRVDAFRYLRSDCSHWFLTHFHMDHYQGLTRSFRHGKIYCSLITARLVNIKLGITWERLHVLPLNEKITVAGIDVTCIDANHCPGAIIILFEPPDGKAVLHTGDFRFDEGMAGISALQKQPIHTLILDTTYCNPQYDFPKQEAVIQFVIEAIQAEAFNIKTLFLIGSYCIGKERLFLEVGRVLGRKVHVAAAKMRLLQCMELPDEDMKWLTLNEQESHIHVVPLWMLANFNRLKHIASQYKSRFSLVVAFSPTGWSFAKGRKSFGRRSQQGTMIRYEVPYSEHSSFTELKEFVRLISPAMIIPSVNNDGPESSNAMLARLSS